MNRLGIVLICFITLKLGSRAFAELSNETVVVTSKATFVLSTNPPSSLFGTRMSVDTNLVFDCKGKPLKTMWFGLPLKGGGDLQPDKEYTFTIRIHHEADHGIRYSWNEIIRIEQNGQRLYSHDICELHEAKMVLKELPISYGLPSFDYINAKRKSFPHGSDHDDGGCSVGPDSPTTSKVYRCFACEKAFKLWKK